MNPTNNTIAILYCPKCKVGIDADLSKRAARPRCGAMRKHLRGTERWLPVAGSSGLAEHLFGQSKKTEELIHQAQDYFFH